MKGAPKSLGGAPFFWLGPSRDIDQCRVSPSSSMARTSRSTRISRTRLHQVWTDQAWRYRPPRSGERGLTEPNPSVRRGSRVRADASSRCHRRWYARTARSRSGLRGPLTTPSGALARGHPFSVFALNYRKLSTQVGTLQVTETHRLSPLSDTCKLSGSRVNDRFCTGRPSSSHLYAR